MVPQKANSSCTETFATEAVEATEGRDKIVASLIVPAQR